MRCAICKDDFDYPTDIKKYGLHHICKHCLPTVTKCDDCGKRRHAKHNTTEGTLCVECLRHRGRRVGWFKCEICNIYHFEGTTTPEFRAQYDLPASICKPCEIKVVTTTEPKDVAPCNFCGEYTKEYTYKGITEHICKYCVEETNPQPCICGEHLAAGTYKLDGYKIRQFMCLECVNKHNKCLVCQTRFLGEGKHCKECTKLTGQCENCGETHILVPDTNLCNQCNRYRKTCPRCGQTTCDVKYTLFDKAACAQCRHELGWGVQEDWKYRPTRFHFIGDTAPFFGIENEISLVKDRHKYINHIAKNFHENTLYCQHDGTIDYGTEVVVHPMSFGAVKDFPFEQMFTPEVKASNSTGMHVHISRASFTKYHLYKFMKFISTNNDFIERIAERKGGGRRQWKFTNPAELASKARGTRVEHNKYIDINLLQPETVEVRLFKGAITPEQLKKNVEFCHALWVFSAQYHVKNMDMVKFTSFVERNQSNYPHLQAFLQKPIAPPQKIKVARKRIATVDTIFFDDLVTGLATPTTTTGRTA